MATENEIVMVASTPWYRNENFWMGVSSSLIASVIFWYILKDWVVDPYEPNQPDEPEEGEESEDVL